MIRHLLATADHVKGLAGLVLSSSLTAASVTVGNIVHPLVGTLPTWGVTILEWSPLVGAPIGLCGMFFYAVNMMLSSRAAARSEREAHRTELREITQAGERLKQQKIKEAHDQICAERRALGSCPFSEFKKEIVAGIKDEILQEVKNQTQNITP